MPLSVDRLICHRLRIPLSKSWDTAYASETFVETLFLKAYAGDVHCWIEVSPLAEPRYMPESAALTELALKEYFAPACLAKEWESSDDLHQSLQQFRGLFAAKACIDIAWHSLYKQVNGRPFYQDDLKGKAGIKLNASITLSDQSEQLHETVDAYIKQGYARVKAKFCQRDDLQKLQDLRQNFSDLALQIDCNGSLDSNDRELFKALDKLQLSCIEQPLFYRDLHQHAELQKKLDTPICLDESICCIEDAETAIAINACRAICLKPARVGGISPLLNILQRCRDAGIDCWIGGMLEAGPGQLLKVDLASLQGMSAVHEINPCGSRYQESFLAEPLTFANGHLEVPDTLNINEDQLTRFRVSSWDSAST